eukprot:m51a1_g2735 putative beta-amylase (445) ;mRNA; f:898551-900192
MFTRAGLVAVALAVAASAIPVSVMLPLDVVGNDGNLKNPEQLRNDLIRLKSTGINGVMTDVWWGLVETAPRVYNWRPYDELASIVDSLGLKLEVVMSFHQCGGNVGDTCDIKLPQWVRDAGAQAFYTDREGHVDYEYVSLSADHRALFGGRTAIDLYHDYMASFAEHFKDLLGSTIDEVQVGTGPCGETRYPAYQMDRWSYCGIGEFQCYDANMMTDLKAAATAYGRPEWGASGPGNAGGYNSKPPSSTDFFREGGSDNFQSEYGRFFQKWYSQVLLDHSSDVLAEAQKIFAPFGVALATKISGIHWWYNDASHAAEMTSGYYNSNGNDAYLQIAQMLAKHNVSFDFTCLEMTDSQNDCASLPQSLVAQAFTAARNAGIAYHGENALELCNPNCWEGGFNQIYQVSTKYGRTASFTYLRMTRNLVDNDNNLNIFRNFVNNMAKA